MKRNRQFTLSSFSNGCFLSRICSDFMRAALFSEKPFLQTSSEQPLRYNNYFFRAAISSEQLLFLRSSFFSEQSIFKGVIFLEYYQNVIFFSYFFRAKNLLRNYYLRIGSSLWKLLFGTATFEERNCLELRHVQMSYFYVAGPPR